MAAAEVAPGHVNEVRRQIFDHLTTEQVEQQIAERRKCGKREQDQCGCGQFPSEPGKARCHQHDRYDPELDQKIERQHRGTQRLGKKEEQEKPR